MTFKSVHWRLTAWYVLVVMIISLMFSAIVYLISFHEISIFNTNQSMALRHLPQVRIAPDDIGPGFDIQGFEDLRQTQLNALKDKMVRNLILTNLIILVLAALASYNFARITLQPIEEIMDLQNRFTADASHELRTPLAAIGLETEVALRDKKFNLPEAKKLLKSNLEEIEKLERLANGLLELAQYQTIQTNPIQMEYEIMPLREIVDEVVAKVVPLAQAKKIKIIPQVKDSFIKCDKNRIVELMTILLDNAVKYSPESKKIWVKTEIARKYALISVQDQGVGIKASDIPYIFNRFYRADQSRSKEKYAGYGLGLSIAKQIVELHHGEIKVESLIGKGTTFTIKLPLV